MHFDSITPSPHSWVENSFTPTTCLGTVRTHYAVPSSSALSALKRCMCTTKSLLPRQGRVPVLLRARPVERSTLWDRSRTELLCDCFPTFPTGSYSSLTWMLQSRAVKSPIESVPADRNSRRISASGG